MTRYFCDVCDRDMTQEPYERYALVLYYANGTPATKERHMGILCPDCAEPVLSIVERKQRAAA